MNTNALQAYCNAQNLILTRKQRRLVAFIWRFRSIHGYSPSFREMMGAVKPDTKNPQAWATHLTALSRKGVVTMSQSAARTVRPAGWILTTPEGVVVPMTDHEAKAMLGKMASVTPERFRHRPGTK